MDGRNSMERFSIATCPTMENDDLMNMNCEELLHSCHQRDLANIHRLGSEMQNLNSRINFLSSQNHYLKQDLAQAQKEKSDILNRNLQLEMRVEKLEAQLQKLEDHAVRKNHENVRLKELLHQKENDFEVEVVAHEKEIKLMQQRFAQHPQKESISARMKNMHLERERNIAEQNVAVLHKKLQEKEVKILKLKEQLKQSEEHNVARFHDLERPTREAFTDAEISLKKGKKRVLEAFKNEKKRKSPGIFKRFWAWLCRGK